MISFENENGNKPATLPEPSQSKDSGEKTLSLPLLGEPSERREAVDIQISQKASCLSCVEIDLTEFEPGSELFKAMREISQDLMESTFHFNINCQVHGQNLFASDLHFSLNGHKLVRSLQYRVNCFVDQLVG